MKIIFFEKKIIKIKDFIFFMFVNNTIFNAEDFFAQTSGNLDINQDFKQLKSALDKQVRTWWDVFTLGKYVKDNNTPRHLRW